MSTTKSRTRDGVRPNLIKAISHPLRADILAILNERVASPNQLSQELGEGLSQVSYHVKVLKDYDCIELVDTKQRRGAVEHFYRATTRAILSDDDWAQLPKSLRSGMSASLVQGMIDDVSAAMRGGTFAARDEHHVSWTPVIVDEEGWRDLAETLSDTLERVFTIQAESAERMIESGEESLSAAVAMIGYEAYPQASRKRGTSGG